MSEPSASAVPPPSDPTSQSAAQTPRAVPQPAAAEPPLPRIGAGRLVVSVLIVLVWFLFLGYLPYVLVGFARSHGATLPVSATFVLAFGLFLAVLAGFRHLSKPTRLWGPALIVSAAAGIVYLLVLLGSPVLSVGTSLSGTSFGFALDYRVLLLVLLIAPVLRLASGIVVTLEDALRPGERVRHQFRLVG